ncbi:MAG: leucine-rich repeat protein [Oscillospiraceae bacterium]|nr:leucine-rich repeat protein [Oscillospiraceae bacterium]
MYGGGYSGIFLLPTHASAETEGYYTYDVTDSEATITNADSEICGDITIPSVLGGYSVTSIGDYAFSGHSSITCITIPDSVNDIGYGAFSWCLGPTKITFQGDAPKFGEDADQNGVVNIAVSARIFIIIKIWRYMK